MRQCQQDGASEQKEEGGGLTILPAIVSILSEGERKQDQRDAGSNEGKTKEIQTVRVRDDFGNKAVARASLANVSALSGLALSPEEGRDEGKKRSGDQNGEHAV